MSHKFFILKSSSPFQIQTQNTTEITSLTSILKTCLGPKSYQKLLITKQQSLLMTSDGFSIIREFDLASPALKLLFEVSRTQDDVAGDGTTSVIILVGEVLKNLVPLVETYHPSLITNCIRQCFSNTMKSLEGNCVHIKRSDVIKLVKGSVSTKLCTVLGVDVEQYAIKACKILSMSQDTLNDDDSVDFVVDGCGSSRIDTNNLRIEKALGSLSDSKIIHGQLINKNIYHSQMRKEIKSPRVVLVQSGLEYKKGESQTLVEFSNSNNFTEALEEEELVIKRNVEHIMKFKPDIVCCEQGIGDFALSMFYNNNVTALRRFKKTEMNRLEKATGAKIVNNPKMVESDCVGTKCGIFKYIKIMDEYYCLFDECYQSNVCTLFLSGPTKDVLGEIERNFWDAFKVVKCLIEDKRIVPGGGSIEFFLGSELIHSNKEKNNSKSVQKNIDKFRRKGKIDDLEGKVYQAISDALKIIPSLLSTNSGGNSVMEIGSLEKKYMEYKKNIGGLFSYGINGKSGKAEDIKDIIMEPIIVKKQILKSVCDAVCMLLRVDGIVQGGNN